MPANGRFVDSSALERIERELAAAREAAEAARRELESFSYAVAHDLRAPLRSIDGFSEALLEDYGADLPEEARKYLGFVRSSAQLMAQLIDELLALARLARTELRHESVDLSALARSTVAALERSDPARQVDVVIEDGLRVSGDPRWLGVMLTSLIGNAWKFTSKRALARIELGASTADGVTTYFVRDDGAGFDMGYARKLFVAFQRLHTVGEFEGNGVGLATAQRIIARHGGRIWAEGAVGEGATFYFTLNEPTRPP